MNQQPLSLQVSNLPDGPPQGATFIPVEMSASGKLLLGSYQTKDAYMKQLQELKHTRKALEKVGYVMHPLTEDSIAQKRKCSRCHKREYTILILSRLTPSQKTTCSHLQEDSRTHQ